MKQRHHDGIEQKQPTRLVRHHRGRVARLPSGHAVEPRYPGHTLNQIIIRRPLGIGAIFAKANGLGVDDARFPGGHGIIVNPQLPGRLRTNIVHKHIGGFRQALQRLKASGLFEIKHDAALVASLHEMRGGHTR